MSRDNDSGTIRCGAFVATVIGYNRYRITCDWLPEWSEEISATQSRASATIITLQAENRDNGPRPKLEVVK